MQKESKNKQIKSSENKSEEQEFFYPSLGVTIKAKSREEADNKAASLQDEKKL